MSTTPELREVMALHIHCVNMLHMHGLAASSEDYLVVKGIWADPLDEDVAGLDEKDPYFDDAQKGHVILLNDTNTFMRGPNQNRTYDLYPPMLRHSDPSSSALAEKSLELLDIDCTGRALLLDFGAIYLKFSFLAQTSVQFYSLQQWNESIRCFSKEDRGFKVALAFEFSNFVLAFLSQDLVFQPEWKTKPKDTPLSALREPSPLEDFPRLLFRVTEWIIMRRLWSENRRRLACYVIREHQDLWDGVGMCTVCELFCKAGLSPFLTEEEVFDCPSRTARLCAALYSYMYESQTKLPAILRAATHGTILAPSVVQRIHSIHLSWLHIVGREKLRVSYQMHLLADDYEKKLQTLEEGDPGSICDILASIFDVFDASLIRCVFEHTKEYGDILGKLIFGMDAWALLRPSHLEAADISDPLTTYFNTLIAAGEISDASHLRLDAYNCGLFQPEEAQHKYHSSYLYHLLDNGRIWSLTPYLPSQAVPDPPRKIVGDEKQSLLLSKIVESGAVAPFGPLEFCGNGGILRSSRKIPVVACSPLADLSLTEAQIIKRAKGIWRRKNPPYQEGKRKLALTPVQRADQENFAAQSLCMWREARERAAALNPVTDSVPELETAQNLSIKEEPSEPAMKKRRKSVDVRIARIGLENGALDGGGPLRRRRTRNSHTLLVKRE